MTDLELNQHIKLTPYDPWLARTILRLFPNSVRPNHITWVRFLFSPLVFWILWQGWYSIGLLAFILVAFTDALDGTLARTRQQITGWGTTYDGVADKFLIGGVVLILVWKHLGLGVASAILAPEFVSLGGALYYKRRGVITPANLWGKIKMNLQVLATVMLLLDLIWAVPILGRVSVGIFAVSIFCGIFSIIRHARDAR